MTPKKPEFTLRLARDETEVRAAQRLRYRVFVEELGGDGALVDHEARLMRLFRDPAARRAAETAGGPTKITASARSGGGRVWLLAFPAGSTIGGFRPGEAKAEP